MPQTIFPCKYCHKRGNITWLGMHICPNTPRWLKVLSRISRWTARNQEPPVGYDN